MENIVWDAQSYVEGVRDRLTSDGNEVTLEQVGDATAYVGYRSHTKLLSRIHTFTLVGAVPLVTAELVHRVANELSDLAKSRRGTMRGVQSGVLAIPGLAGYEVEPAARDLAEKPFQLGMGGFAALVHPVVVDLSRESVHMFRGRRVWGAALGTFIRKQAENYFEQ